MKTVSAIAQKGRGRHHQQSFALTCAAAYEGLSALVVDLGPQASAASWGDWRRSSTLVAGTRDLIAAVTPRAPVLCVLNGAPPRGPQQKPQARARRA